MGRRSLRFALTALIFCFSSHGAETDQFLAWNVELADSGPAVNEWLNHELESFLDAANSNRRLRAESPERLAILYLRHVFDVRPFARINELYNSGKLDEFPPREEVSFFQYQRMSIYRGPAFPFVLFMARTIRMGEVYLGIDKLSHFLGYGRRYFSHALDLERNGLTEAEIAKRLIERGLRDELWLTGRAVNGVTSRSDLEANYQGYRFATDLCSGESPVIAFSRGRWVQQRPIDILPYITPHFDESFYTNQFWAARKRKVLPIIELEYGTREQSASIQARFHRYRMAEPSLNVKYLEELMRARSEP